MSDNVTPFRPPPPSAREQWRRTEEKLMIAYATIHAAHNAIAQSTHVETDDDILLANIAIGGALESLEEVRDELSNLHARLKGEPAD